MNALLLLAVIVVLAGPVVAAPPVVSNVRAAQLAGTKNIEVLYDVSDADGDLLTIAMQVSGDAGQTYTIPATALSGHIGTGVASGLNRRIIWNAGTDWNGQLVSTAKVRVTASDGTTPAPPPGMVYIPAGTFQMGDNLDSDTNSMPVHQVYVSGFFMDRFEVTKELWQSVQAWSTGHGYSIGGGAFAANGHPVQTLYWFNAVAWCNARSEKEGLTPCYYTDTAQTLVYRDSSSPNLTNAMVKWTANGYRLPTEAEWEKAARGGSLGLRYPWGNSISGSQANYGGSGDPFESSNPGTTPVSYYNGTQVPVGADMANGYGLYDIAGNVAEFCWDINGSYAQAGSTDPRGPDVWGDFRVVRGGAWSSGASGVNPFRCSARSYILANVNGSSGGTSIGFRTVRGP